MSRTGIVCTIGPASNSEGTLRALACAGMTVARLNGSQADLEWHWRAVELIRSTVPEIPIIFDIPGRKIRVSAKADECHFLKGDNVVLTTATERNGAKRVLVNRPVLHEEVAEGMCILAEDGAIRLTVEKVEGREIHCRAETAGVLKSGKGISVPCLRLRTYGVSDHDRRMVEFARDKGVDFVGISFVESAQQIEDARRICGESGPRVLSKIESQGGLDNLEEIVAAADAVMVDRGDLSVETNLEQVTLFQKRILEAAKADAKPVIVATEMLHSMIKNAFPTKAEVSDITNAVLDGAAATMLSGETAVGAHPVEAVKIMRRIADAAVNHMHACRDRLPAGREASVPEATEEAISVLCRQLPVTKIVVITLTGYAARRVANRRPSQPVLAVTNNEGVARSFKLLPGTEGVYVSTSFVAGSTDHIIQALEGLWRKGKIHDKDLILVTAAGYPRPGNFMNLIQTHQVADLIAIDWGRK